MAKPGANIKAAIEATVEANADSKVEANTKQLVWRKLRAKLNS